MPGPFFWFSALVDLVTLAMAVRFTLYPSERSLAILRPLSAATVFSALAAFLLGLANGLAFLSRSLERSTDPAGAARVWTVFISGMAESPAALVLAFAVLSAVWLLVAVGLRRQV
jgi:hypothetical protein